MQTIAVIFLVLQVALGFAVSAFFDPDNKLSRAEFFFKSVVLGVTSSSFILLLLLLVTRSWSAAVPLLWVLLIASGALVVWKRFKNVRLRPLAQVNFSLASCVTFAGLLVILALYSAIILGVFLVDGEGFPSGILKGWGDVAYHLDMIGRLKLADPFVLEQPVASGERLTYPFMINLLSALYERIGFSKTVAWHLPVFLFGVSFFSLVFLLGKRIFGDDKFALVLVLIVFFGGGIGFFWFFQDIWNAWHSGGVDAAFSTLTEPPHEYTHLDNRTGGKPQFFDALHNIMWIVPVISFLSHQRSFVSGLSVTVLIILGFLLYRGSPKLWRWGALWGMMPFLHTHTFMAVTVVLVFWFFYDIKNWLAWLKGGVLGSVLALPQALFLMPAGLLDSGNSSFFQPWLGWMTCTHGMSWYACDPGVEGVDSNSLWFWTKNFGLVFWAWIIGVFVLILTAEKYEERYARIKPFLLPSVVLFLLPNTVLFQPWEFDNNKILYSWWIFASIISIFLFETFYRSRRIVPLIFTVFAVSSACAGTIDVLSRTLDFRENHYGYYGQSEIETAEWVSVNTEPNDPFLTGDSPNQFIPMLTGRPLYLGYTGWLWTQGKNDLIQSRKSLAASFLVSGDPSSICGEGVKYVLWDADLLRTYPGADRKEVLSASEVVYSQNTQWGEREIFKIQCSEY